MTAPALMLASLSGTKGAAVTGAELGTGDFNDAGAEFAADNSVLKGCLSALTGGLLAVADAESSVEGGLECGVVGEYGLCCGAADFGSTAGWGFGCESAETPGAVLEASDDVEDCVPGWSDADAVVLSASAW